MPTIEIASVNSLSLELNQADFDFATIEEPILRSHRGLFSHILTSKKGVIVHIGNPEFKTDKKGGYFAGMLVDWNFEGNSTAMPDFKGIPSEENSRGNQQSRFKFLDQFIPNLDKLLKIALNKSPAEKIYFLTDYQFGPEHGAVENIFSISNFWKIHDSKGLRFNTLYEMRVL